MIYVDLRYSFAVGKNAGKFNGGNNYSQNILKLLVNEYKNVIPICGDLKVRDYIIEKYGIDVDSVIVEKSLDQIDFMQNSIYYNPQAQDSNQYLIEIKKLKGKYPNLKIKMTIHDRRHHEDILDKYNGMLNEGLKSNYILLGIGRFINSIRKDYIVKQLLRLSDEIYTVSNYSMQELIKLGNPKNISYYTQGIGFDDELTYDTENYILFVSAGRSEKNFIRGLKAFEVYVKQTDSNIKLKVTGLSEKQKEIVINRNIIDEKILKNQVELLGYLSNDEFSSIYAKCQFLLFTSKSEGYGLPVSEAMFFEKPAVVSRKSAIPEIMGAAAVYVDPYSVDSIYKGICKMMDVEFYEEILEYTKRKKDIWKNQVSLDERIFIGRILSK